MKKKSDKGTFKPYQMNQMCLPMSLDDLIPGNHLDRVVNSAIERMIIDPLLKQYKGGGAGSYHPQMMLKVTVYAYTQKIYSSRRIAKALRETSILCGLAVTTSQTLEPSTGFGPQ